MVDINAIARKVDALKARNSARDARMQDVLAVRKGQMADIYPDLFPEGLDKTMVANFVDVAARDLAEVLAPLPSFNCSTTNVTNDRARVFADKRSMMANNYVYSSRLQSQMYWGADWYFGYKRFIWNKWFKRNFRFIWYFRYRWYIRIKWYRRYFRFFRYKRK